MRVLITWGSKRGGTESIARVIAETLRESGVDVIALPAAQAHAARDFDAAIVGGALYANHWHPAARRFVRRCAPQLRRVPTWFFSSGPLDDSASRGEILPVRQADAAMALVGAQGHKTFGGRLAPDADTMLAKHHAGDWRDLEQIRGWARSIAHALPTLRPGPYVAPPGHALARLLGYGGLAWALSACLFVALLWATSLRVAIDVTLLVAPALYIVTAWRYFGARAARDPLPAAFAFAAVGALLQLAVFAGMLEHSLVRFAHLSTWLLLALVFAVTWATGALRAMLPTGPRPTRRESRGSAKQAAAAH
jgi:menaquinone-dependent protoporphyrinogen oxidase